jgi:hypothetical protein
MHVPAPDKDPDQQKQVATCQVGSIVQAPPAQNRMYRLQDDYPLPDSVDDNAAQPRGLLKRFKPIHNMMAYMAAAGRTTKEIAEVTGFSYSQVREVLAQPAMKDEMKRIVEESGSNYVETVLSREVLPSIETLITIRDENIRAKPQVSAAAANSLLDRYLGKPTTRVENTNFDGGKIEDSVDAKMQELQRIEANMRAAGASIFPSGGAN